MTEEQYRAYVADYNAREFPQYTGAPRVLETGRGVFVIAGVDYGYVHNWDGTIRTWQTRSGARSFLRRHFAGAR
jgi:hypothetical protein